MHAVGRRGRGRRAAENMLHHGERRAAEPCGRGILDLGLLSPQLLSLIKDSCTTCPTEVRAHALVRSQLFLLFFSPFFFFASARHHASSCGLIRHVTATTFDQLFFVFLSAAGRVRPHRGGAGAARRRGVPDHHGMYTVGIDTPRCPGRCPGRCHATCLTPAVETTHAGHTGHVAPHAYSPTAMVNSRGVMVQLGWTAPSDQPPHRSPPTADKNRPHTKSQNPTHIRKGNRRATAV